MSKITPIKLSEFALRFPGSGKTFFARQLAEHIQCAHVQSDRIRYELFEEPRFDKQENQNRHKSHGLHDRRISLSGRERHLRCKRLPQISAINLRDIGRKNGAKTIVVWLQIDAETAFARLQKRDRRRADDRYAVNYSKEAFQNLLRTCSI